MPTLQDALDAATAQDTTIDSVVAFLAVQKAQLMDLLSGIVLAPSVQAGIDKLFDFDTRGKQKLDEALAANVPTPTT